MKFCILFVVIGIGTLVMPNIAFSADLTGNVLGIIFFSRTAEIDSVLANADITSYGWIRTSSNYQQIVIMEDVSLRFNDEDAVHATGRGGRFSIKGVSSGVRLVHILNSQGEEIAVQEIIVPDGVQEMFVPVVILNNIEHHQCCHKLKSADKPGIDAPAYLDYNGPFGNCINYSSGWWKYQNFIASDCNIAMQFPTFMCWNELMPGYYCSHWGVKLLSIYRTFPISSLPLIR